MWGRAVNSNFTVGPKLHPENDQNELGPSRNMWQLVQPFPKPEVRNLCGTEQAKEEGSSA